MTRDARDGTTWDRRQPLRQPLTDRNRLLGHLSGSN